MCITWLSAVMVLAATHEVEVSIENPLLQHRIDVPVVISVYDVDAPFEINVITIDGHDFDQIEAALKEAETIDKPVAIIANTVKGKGVSFMENQVSWHGSAPNDEQYEKAMAELKAQYDEI